MKFTRKILKGVEGYVPGEQPQRTDVIKLNTNENPYPPSPKVMEALRSLSQDALVKYPDPVSGKFRRECAMQYGYPGEDWVIAGNGMDEVLAMTIRTFVDPGDSILTTDPTYTLYETLADLHGAKTVKVELDAEFQLPESFYTAPARACFITRPNAPSGVCAPRAAMERLCKNFNGIVVIDEAYVDFADDNCMDFPERFDNVIVARTFSKSYSLAGMRLGIGVARPEIIAEYIKTKDSYNMNAVAQAVGIAAMEDMPHMQANVEKVRATRLRTIQELTTLGFQIPPSQSNFILACWQGAPTARGIFERLRDRGIYVRYFDTPRLKDALRITIGTDKQMEALLNAIREII
ncbi:MAG: histidinol-phosphate aminotransferase [Candidatus Hydrogenedentota bacterium]